MDKTELYLTALTVLGVTADRALAFEDSPAGVRAAKRSRVWCAAVPNEVTRLATFDEADVTLESLEPHSLERILRMAVAN